MWRCLLSAVTRELRQGNQGQLVVVVKVSEVRPTTDFNKSGRGQKQTRIGQLLTGSLEMSPFIFKLISPSNDGNRAENLIFEGERNPSDHNMILKNFRVKTRIVELWFGCCLALWSDGVRSHSSNRCASRPEADAVQSLVGLSTCWTEQLAPKQRKPKNLLRDSEDCCQRKLLFRNIAKSPHYSGLGLSWGGGVGGDVEVRRLRAKHICFAK